MEECKDLKPSMCGNRLLPYFRECITDDESEDSEDKE